MTDLFPDVQALLDESYKSDLTEEESEELLLLCGHGIGKKLSPAAQVVLDAVLQKSNLSPTLPAAAAALRAAADQADPKKHIEDIDYVPEMYTDGCHDTIATFLAIAAELEGNNAANS